MRKLLIVFAAIMLLNPLFANSNFTARKIKLLTKKIDRMFSPWNKPDSPGCAVAVIQAGHIIFKKGYGMAHLEHNIPITPETIFYIGSASKQFVAACILLLAEENKLSLDDDIRLTLNDFPDYGQPITLRHLLHHTSGIRDDLALWFLSGRSYLDHMPEKEVYDLVCRQRRLNFPAGEQFMYSNSSYFLLGMIVAKVSGTSLRKYADRFIFKPLGMHHSQFNDDITRIIKNRAQGYTRKNSGFGNLIMRFDLVGSGGLYTNINDLSRWDRNFYQNRLGRRNRELITALTTPGRLNSGKEINYACALIHGRHRGNPTIYHGGSLGGYRAQMLRFPDHRFSVIILSNLDSFNPSAMAYKVADLFLPAKPVESRKEESGSSSFQPERSAVEDSGDQILESIAFPDFAGTYYSDELRVHYRVSTGNGHLLVKIPNQPVLRLKYAGRDTFKGRYSITFHRDGDQKVNGFTFDSQRVKGLTFVRR